MDSEENEDRSGAANLTGEGVGRLGTERPLRVLGFSIGPEAEPSSRFRLYQWREPLAREGIELDIRPLTGERYFEMGYGLRRVSPAVRGPWVASHFLGRVPRRVRDLAAARRYDLLWIQKETFPLGLEGLVPRLGLRCVYDFDDAVHLAADALPGGQGRALRRVAEAVMGRERALSTLLTHCSLVLAGNRVLADWARPHAPGRVAILPTVIDTDAYGTIPRRREGPITIGWFGAPEGAAYLEPLRPALRALARRFDFRLRVHGAQFECPGVRVECVPWKRYSEVSEEVADLLSFDIGLMPLPDTERAAGKCALKAIQYMGCGIPVVASPVGVAGDVIGDGGRLAESPGQWAHALHALLDDAELRARLGAAGRERARRLYSIGAWTPHLGRWLREAARAPRPRGRAATTTTTAASAPPAGAGWVTRSGA